MDKISKFLKRISVSERNKVLIFVEKITGNKLSEIKYAKLKGFKDLYKVRFGKIRIIFRKTAEGNIVINIEYRKNVYRDL